MNAPFSEDRGVQLMLALQAGDSSAFAELVKEYEGRAFALLRRMLGPAAPIEDLAQEAFLRVWRNRDRYQAVGKFSTWFYRILHNLALNSARDSGRKPVSRMPKSPEGEDLALPDSSVVEPWEASTPQEWAPLIDRGLQQLPENQRAALVFQHYEGLSLDEIGDLLGVSGKAVKSLLYRSRENLRDFLAPYRKEEQ